ncbi:hypothetical protein EV426DRAFT_282477 [Tirmania nivea]|nr:hypothetical protein EV426DRAFT_282477 [Tirmania nivea]
MDQVPDEVLDLARQTFPSMTDAEIMTMLLEGSEEDIQIMVGNAVGEGPNVRAPKGKVVAPGVGGGKMRKPRLREVPVVARAGVEVGVENENKVAEEQEEAAKVVQPQAAENAEVKSITPAAVPAPSAPALQVRPPPKRYDSLAEELAAMTPAEKAEVAEFMASLGLPDITKGLPAGFDPMLYPPEIQDLAKMLVEQLGPTTMVGQQPVQPMPSVQPVQPQQPQGVVYDASTLSPEQIEAIWAIIYAPQTPSTPPSVSAPASPSSKPPKTSAPPPKPQATSVAASPKKNFSADLPPDIRTLIPPRPLNQIPSYPGNQLPTPHNPLYTYPLSQLNHVDPYHALDPTHPHSKPTTYTRFPPLPDAHTRYHINNPICIPPESTSSPAGPPRFTDCSRAVSNILSSLTAQTCTEAKGWSVTRHVVSEFGTCRVVVRNERGKAGCVELEKVKHLAGRVLRECGVGVMRDRRLRTVEGHVGYLFVDEEKGVWDTMEVAIERASFE